MDKPYLIDINLLSTLLALLTRQNTSQHLSVEHLSAQVNIDLNLPFTSSLQTLIQLLTTRYTKISQIQHVVVRIRGADEKLDAL